jgi:hypothetical protein
MLADISIKWAEIMTFFAITKPSPLYIRSPPLLEAPFRKIDMKDVLEAPSRKIDMKDVLEAPPYFKKLLKMFSIFSLENRQNSRSESDKLFNFLTFQRKNLEIS